LNAMLKKSDKNKLWMGIQLLMLIVFLHHALQPILSWIGLFSWKPKYYVSLGGGFLYGTALVLLLKRSRVGLYIAVLGPISGTLILTTGALLMWLNIIHFEFRQDLSTILGGIPQVIALVIALSLLKKERSSLDLT